MTQHFNEYVSFLVSAVTTHSVVTQFRLVVQFYFNNRVTVAALSAVNHFFRTPAWVAVIDISLMGCLHDPALFQQM